MDPAAPGQVIRQGRGQIAAPTIYDVAQAAGVAIGTVSQALNGRGRMRPATRERIQAEADRLGFRPNDLAHSLLRGRSFTVGLLSTDSYGRFSIPVMAGIEDALGTAQVSVFLCDTQQNPERERHYIDSLLAKRVDGIIVTAPRTDPRPPIDVDTRRVPVLYAYSQVADPDTLCLLPDDAQGARLAVEHLLQHGRRHLAHITGPEQYEAVRLRATAMRHVLAENGIDLPDGHILHGPWRENWGYTAVGRLLAADPRVDAIFCGSDQVARGVVDGLHERGVRVPDDVAVVGFDNWEALAGATRPPLTTVDICLHELGRQAGLRLLAIIAGDPARGHLLLPCRLVVRDSCGTPATHARSSRQTYEEREDEDDL
ncbi:MAG: LacI family transcriptional regulator [Chloroflexi bacterium]|nr:LacI family transcriptional regulator [Chloroflexota bacterium]